jgi:hypothetical protein
MQLTFILKRAFMVIVIVLIIIALIIAGLQFWYTHRPLPPAITDQSLFEGVTYTRIIQTDPIAQIIHITKIDLQADGLSFLVTPSGELNNFDFEARTTSQFLDEFDLQLAINADFFDPWKDYGPLNYYPHVGEGANVRGLSASQGDITTVGYVPPQDYVTLYISKDNRASFSTPEGEIYNAVSGNISILDDGQIPQFEDEPYFQKRHPRTAVGLTEDENTLILVIVDGRQPNYSQGATLPELSQILVDAGAHNAINLDGGGSSTIVMSENGNPSQLNSSIQSRIPARERPIANHLGIYAKHLP